MNKTFCRWNKEEIKTLFNFIKEQTDQTQTRAQAFTSYAKKANRKPNSVRNYYYLELEYLQKNIKEAQMLGIDLAFHQKQEPNYFSEEETKKCMDDIKKLVEKGNSVRKACLVLSGGNIEQMVRLQNKYRSLKKTEKTAKTSKPFSPSFANNIISMPERNKGLTEQEINSLFLGLLKLIKASAKQEYLTELSKKTQEKNHELRKTLISLNEKEKELKKLRENFELLKQENNKAKQTITNLRTETATLIANSHIKMEALKTYSNKIKSTRKPPQSTIK